MTTRKDFTGTQFLGFTHNNTESKTVYPAQNFGLRYVHLNFNVLKFHILELHI